MKEMLPAGSFTTAPYADPYPDNLSRMALCSVELIAKWRRSLIVAWR